MQNQNKNNKLFYTGIIKRREFIVTKQNTDVLGMYHIQVNEKNEKRRSQSLKRKEARHMQRINRENSGNENVGEDQIGF